MRGGKHTSPSGGEFAKTETRPPPIALGAVFLKLASQFGRFAPDERRK